MGLFMVNKEVTFSDNTLFFVISNGPVPLGDYPILTSAVSVTGTAGEGSVPVGTEIKQNATTVYLHVKPPKVAGALWNDGWFNSVDSFAMDMDTYFGFIYLGLGGITVSLYDSNDVLVGSAVTDVWGNYEIESSASGSDFYLVFTQPTILDFESGSVFDNEGEGGGHTLTYTDSEGLHVFTPTDTAFVTAGDSQVDINGRTASFDLSAGDYLTRNAGAYLYA
jgi:hypothetical protein